MVLTKEQIYELNKKMVLGGAPTEKDDVGYNKPDYVIMNAFASMSLESLTFEHFYNMLLCLNHYKNTQLSAYKDDLEETKAFVKKKANKDISDALDNQIGFLYHKKKEAEKEAAEKKWKETVEKNKVIWKEEQLKVYEQMRNSIEILKDNIFEIQLTWKGRIDDMSEFVRKTDGVKWEKLTDKWTVLVDLRSLPEMITLFREHSYKTEILDKRLEEFLSTDQEVMVKDYFKDEPLKIKRVLSNEYSSSQNVYFTTKNLILPGQVKDLVEDFAQENGFKVNKNKHFFYLEMKKEDSDLLGKLFDSFDFNYSVDDELLEEMRIQYGRRFNKATLIDTDKLALPFKPYPFQLEDARLMLKNKKTLLCSEMGAGKTLVAVLVGESIKKPKLVVCPESLRINWEREIHQVNPAADVRTIYNAKNLSFSKEWNIIGYASIAKLQEQILEEKFDVVFFDEAHMTKAIGNNGAPTSKRGKAALIIAKQAEYCYPMTGTPIPTSNRDLYNLLAMICHPITLGKWSFFEYGKEFCNGEQTRFGWDFTGNSNNDKLNEILADNDVMVRHLKKDVLPHLKKQRIFLPISVNAKKVNAEIEEALAKSESDNKNNFLAYAMTGRRILSLEKVKQTIEFTDTILSQNKSAVIVDEFNDTLDYIVEHYGKESVAVIRGGMTDKEKQAEIDAFQKGSKKICAMNIVAGGVGITLTKSHNLIFNSYNFTPGMMVQAEDRICRGNQTELCNVYYMYAENVPLDKVFTDLLTEKFYTINSAVDGGDGDAVNMVEEILKALFTKTGTLRKKYQG